MFNEQLKKMPMGERLAAYQAVTFLLLMSFSNKYFKGNVAFIAVLGEESPWPYRGMLLLITAMVLYFPMKYGLNPVKSKVLRGLIIIVLGFFAYFGCSYIYSSASAVITKKIGVQANTFVVVAKKPISVGRKCEHEMNFRGYYFHGKRPCLSEEEAKHIHPGQKINVTGKLSFLGMVIEDVNY